MPATLLTDKEARAEWSATRRAARRAVCDGIRRPWRVVRDLTRNARGKCLAPPPSPPGQVAGRCFMHLFCPETAYFPSGLRRFRLFSVWVVPGSPEPIAPHAKAQVVKTKRMLVDDTTLTAL